MCKNIYPDGGRKNNLSGIYCKMAMESYYRASNFYKEIQEANFSFDKCYEKNELEKMVISTVVFSAMCLESFFNDYIAAVLGDDRLYNMYDCLAPQNKFCFISEFIFRKRVDKSQTYYAGIKNLVKYRNEYVHNKSKKVEISLFSVMQHTEFKEMLEQANGEFKLPLLKKTELDIDLKKALEALKAIKDIARYFDEHDSSCWAMIRLFGENNLNLSSPYEQEYMKEIFQKLGIKRGPLYEI